MEEEGISLKQAREMITSGSSEEHAVIEEMVARAIDEGTIIVDGSIVPMEGDLYSFVDNTLTTDEKLYSLTGLPTRSFQKFLREVEKNSKNHGQNVKNVRNIHTFFS